MVFIAQIHVEKIFKILMKNQDTSKLLRSKLGERESKMEKLKDIIKVEGRSPISKSWLKPTSTYNIRTEKIKHSRFGSKDTEAVTLSNNLR